ncbi:MAG: methyltransferase domain-containing protein [Anaerolineae bacterium]|jgi:ubiquinone/menaquinone biosynthesis C-methylase UbiE|nr:methyltransferase domain-containing protein [Anaerolineae bacterium]MBT7191133.1 methyltransferase domain-containing protein [Anaerolineae bacterium]MBT7988315.1 methyltransferase domain-containing protein [Anaerolineae bacterium]
MLKISRVSRTKEEASQNYDRLSRLYDLFASSEKKFTDFGLEMLAVQSGESVLEIGFGTGHALLKLARAAHPAIVNGIDISKKMRIVAERKLRRAGLKNAIRLKTGDAAKLPYDNFQFDAIFISFTLELFDTPEMPFVLQECYRVLKPGGRLGVVALKKECRAIHVYEWFHEKMPTFVDCRPIYAKESIEDVGFQITKNKKMTMWGLPVDILLAKK